MYSNKTTQKLHFATTYGLIEIIKKTLNFLWQKLKLKYI